MPDAQRGDVRLELAAGWSITTCFAPSFSSGWTGQGGPCDRRPACRSPARRRPANAWFAGLTSSASFRRMGFPRQPGTAREGLVGRSLPALENTCRDTAPRWARPPRSGARTRARASAAVGAIASSALRGGRLAVDGPGRTTLQVHQPHSRAARAYSGASPRGSVGRSAGCCAEVLRHRRDVGEERWGGAIHMHVHSGDSRSEQAKVSAFSRRRCADRRRYGMS